MVFSFHHLVSFKYLHVHVLLTSVSCFTISFDLTLIMRVS